MHGESAVFVDVVAMCDSGAVVRVCGVANRVHEGAAGPQDASNLADQHVDLLSRQGHAQQHVGEDRVRRGVRQWQWFTDVVRHGGDALGDALSAGGLVELIQSGAAEIGGLDRESFAGEVQGVAAMAAPSSSTSLAPRARKMSAAWTAGPDGCSPYMPGWSA